VWAVVSDARSTVHEAQKKIQTYAGLTESLVLSLVAQGKESIKILEDGLLEVDRARDRQTAFQIRGRLRKNLKRFDMQDTRCVFRVLDSYLVSIGQEPTNWGRAFIK
jgi:hypothetical protein